MKSIRVNDFLLCNKIGLLGVIYLGFTQHNDIWTKFLHFNFNSVHRDTYIKHKMPFIFKFISVSIQFLVNNIDRELTDEFTKKNHVWIYHYYNK